MKTPARYLPILTLLALLPGTLMAQGTAGVMVRWMLEGGPGGMQEMTLYTAETDVAMTRLEMGSQAILITNGEHRIMLMPDQQMWMDLSELEAMAGRMGTEQRAEAAAVEDALPEIEPTGETGNFAGTACTYYRVRDGDSVIDVCAATGLGWGMGPSPGGGMMGARGGLPGRGMAGGRGGLGGASTMSSERYRQLQERFADGFFPLEIRMTGQGQEIRMYATELEKRTFDANMFPTEGPESYQKMSMFGRGRGGV